MDKYIKKWPVVDKLTALENELQQYKPFRPCESAMYRRICDVEIEIGKMDAEDVAPVVHGRWIMRGGKRYCSECGNRACVTRDSDDFWYTVGTDYCPTCGAKMDLEELNEAK